MELKQRNDILKQCLKEHAPHLDFETHWEEFVDDKDRMYYAIMDAMERYRIIKIMENGNDNKDS